MTTPSTLPTVLLGQWQSSPRILAIVEIITELRTQGLAALDFIARMLDVDETEGVWMDYIGQRLGLDRPATSDPTLDERWGFDDAGRGFEQVPFRGDVANDAVYPLPDEIYRTFLKARIVTLLTDGTIFTFSRAVRFIDPNATIVDNRNMTIGITSARQAFLELADEIGALPRTAGVRLVYA